MAYDEGLAARVLNALEGQGGLEQKKMFGGWAAMLEGNMAVGVIGDELCVRCGPDAYAALLQLPGARVFDFSGRPAKGMLMIDQSVISEDADLHTWIQHGVSFASSLPPK